MSGRPKNSKQKKEDTSTRSKESSVLYKSVPRNISDPREAGLLIQTHLKRGGNARDIPFLLPYFKKGTQVAELRLSTDYKNLTFSAGVAYATVTSVAFSDFTNATQLVSVFDEVRPVRGIVRYLPRYTASTTGAIHGAGGAAIDYTNSTAFTSSAQLLDHDTKVLFPIYATFMKVTGGRKHVMSTSWPILFDGQPDEAWLIATNSTVLAYWKPYFNAGDVTGSGVLAYLYFEIVFQFRGLS